DAVVLPGGFSYGDYLRCGAIARFAPVMRAVASFAADGGLVVGICNGFQVLCEAGLLPGVLRPNASLTFVCRDVALRVENAETPFTSRCEPGQGLVIPVKHGEGCWTYPEDELRVPGQLLEQPRQVVETERHRAPPNGAVRRRRVGQPDEPLARIRLEQLHVRREPARSWRPLPHHDLVHEHGFAPRCLLLRRH